MKKTWTVEMEDLLRKTYPVLPAEDIFKIFPCLSKGSIKSKAANMKLRKKGKLYTWRYEDELKLIEIYHNTLNVEIGKMFGRTEAAVSAAAFKLRLKKSAEFMRFYTLKTAFKPGNKPFNKGMKQNDYMTAAAIERTKSTRFKTGNVPHNTKPEGENISIRKDNRGIEYYFIRVGLGVWIHLHVYLWEQKYGKVPEGYMVTLKDLDPMNCKLENLELITMAGNMIRNSGSVNLSDSMVASYMSKQSMQVNYELRDSLLNRPDLLELKRNQLLLNREIKKQINGKTEANS